MNSLLMCSFDDYSRLIYKCANYLWNHAKEKGSHAEADGVVVRRSIRFVSASTVHTAAERAFLLLFTVVLLLPFKSKSLLCFRTRVVAVATKLEVAELTAVAVEVTRSPLSFSASDAAGGRCSCLCRWWWWCLLLPKHAGMVIHRWNDGESTLYEQSTPAYFFTHWIKIGKQSPIPTSCSPIYFPLRVNSESSIVSLSGKQILQQCRVNR